MSYKYVYPSIEYVLATGHYPDPCRKHVRHHPTFFHAPPVQVFHVAHGHIPVFLPLVRNLLFLSFSSESQDLCSTRQPPSYGYSKRHPDPEHALVNRPRNRCFTVT